MEVVKKTSVNTDKAIKEEEIGEFNLETAKTKLEEQNNFTAKVDDIDIVGVQELPEDKRKTPEQLYEEYKEHVFNTMRQLKGPSKTDLAVLQQQYGDIFVYHHDDKHVYVCHPLSRQLWNQIETGTMKPIGCANKPEIIFSVGVIWPDPRTINYIQTLKAGIIDTVANLIMYHSGFVDMDFALSKVFPI